MLILDLFNNIICLCKSIFVGSSSNFLYIASNILSLISLAAALVNVTINILSISTLSFITLFIILSTKLSNFFDRAKFPPLSFYLVQIKFRFVYFDFFMTKQKSQAENTTWLLF